MESYRRINEESDICARMLLVAMVAILGLGIGLVAWNPTGEYSEFCQLSIPLVEPPAGWEVERDHHNGCAVTLVNENGDRAPKELYAEVQLDPPPDYPNDWDVPGWTMIVGSIVAGTMSFRTRLP